VRVAFGPVALLAIGTLISATIFGQEKAPATNKSSDAAEDALIEDLPIVQAASLHQQTLQEAPADVTIITAAEIRKYGYRTFGEALNSVRGFYSTSDRIYNYIGVAGFSLPGDFNTRFLVMINGHAMTEHTYDSNNFFGEDFGLDMDLVERIEIIRGSASALYGSNAMLATINVITRSPADDPGFHATTETGSFGEKKAQFSESLYLGKGANLLVSGAYFANSGQTLFIPQYNSPATNNGIVTNGDGEQGYHFFANLIWRDWSVTAYFNSRRKLVPVNWADNTVFADGGSSVRDGRNFVEVARSQDIGDSGKLRYRFYYDDYRYDDRFDYNFGNGVIDQRSLGRNEWLGSEITYTMDDSTHGTLLLGTQGEWELRNLQQEWNVSPAVQIVRFNIPDRTVALFAQQEWHFSRRWKAYAGARFDSSHNYGNSISPRLALIYQQSPTTVYKAVYGRPFRDPSAFEKYFDDNETLVSNLNLHAEHANTFEVTAEHKLSQQLTGILNVYQYRTGDLIEEVFPADGGVPRFQNIQRVQSTGFEMELSAKLPHELELLWSATLQDAVDADRRLALPNSPGILGKFRAGLPIFHRLFVSSSMRFMNPRDTVAGGLVPAVFLQDFTVTTRHPLFANFDLQLGIRNVWNTLYDDPVGLAVDTIRQDGRAVYLKAIWHGRQ
jgi:outer membrane receptor for ferrienterochelin and colicins